MDGRRRVGSNFGKLLTDRSQVVVNFLGRFTNRHVVVAGKRGGALVEASRLL